MKQVRISLFLFFTAFRVTQVFNSCERGSLWLFSMAICESPAPETRFPWTKSIKDHKNDLVLQYIVFGLGSKLCEFAKRLCCLVFCVFCTACLQSVLVFSMCALTCHIDVWQNKGLVIVLRRLCTKCLFARKCQNVHASSFPVPLEPPPPMWGPGAGGPASTHHTCFCASIDFFVHVDGVVGVFEISRWCIFHFRLNKYVFCVVKFRESSGSDFAGRSEFWEGVSCWAPVNQIVRGASTQPIFLQKGTRVPPYAKRHCDVTARIPSLLSVKVRERAISWVELNMRLGRSRLKTLRWKFNTETQRCICTDYATPFWDSWFTSRVHFVGGFVGQTSMMWLLRLTSPILCSRDNMTESTKTGSTTTERSPTCMTTRRWASDTMEDSLWEKWWRAPCPGTTRAAGTRPSWPGSSAHQTPRTVWPSSEPLVRAEIPRTLCFSREAPILPTPSTKFPVTQCCPPSPTWSWSRRLPANRVVSTASFQRLVHIDAMSKSVRRRPGREKTQHAEFLETVCRIQTRNCMFAHRSCKCLKSYYVYSHFVFWLLVLTHWPPPPPSLSSPPWTSHQKCFRRAKRCGGVLDHLHWRSPKFWRAGGGWSVFSWLDKKNNKFSTLFHCKWHGRTAEKKAVFWGVVQQVDLSVLILDFFAGLKCNGYEPALAPTQSMATPKTSIDKGTHDGRRSHGSCVLHCNCSPLLVQGPANNSANTVKCLWSLLLTRIWHERSVCVGKQYLCGVLAQIQISILPTIDFQCCTYE